MDLQNPSRGPHRRCPKLHAWPVGIPGYQPGYLVVGKPGMHQLKLQSGDPIVHCIHGCDHSNFGCPANV